VCLKVQTVYKIYGTIVVLYSKDHKGVGMAHKITSHNNLIEQIG